MFPPVGKFSVKVFCAVMSTAKEAMMPVFEATVAVAAMLSLLFASGAAGAADRGAHGTHVGRVDARVTGTDDQGAGDEHTPPTVAETVELSVVLPIDASPAIRPPLPAVLEASFSSVPIAEMPSVPLTSAVVPAPSWAEVATFALAVATSAPLAKTPPTATPVALAICRLEFTASIVTFPPSAISVWAVPPAAAFAESVMLPGVVEVEATMFLIVVPAGMSAPESPCPTASPAVLGMPVTVAEPLVSVPVKRTPVSIVAAPVVAITLPPLSAVLTVALTPASTPPTPAVAEAAPSGRCSSPGTDRLQPRAREPQL